MVFGDKLKELRKQQKLSLGELADRSEVNKGYLWSLENGRQKNPGILKAMQIADALGVDLNFLLSEKDLVDSLPGEDLPPALQKLVELREQQKRPLSSGDVADLLSIQFRGKRPTQASHYESLMAQLEIFTRENEKTQEPGEDEDHERQ